MAFRWTKSMISPFQSKYEDWAVRMSLELEEAESYELSVED